jgi:hypothetical protein
MKSTATVTAGTGMPVRAASTASDRK